uniref:Uncharacterized protein n=1 Tax=Neobodo designis TaxID=312471 RepID=A0A7S1LPZ4_NEODS
MAATIGGASVGLGRLWPVLVRDATADPNGSREWGLSSAVSWASVAPHVKLRQITAMASPTDRTAVRRSRQPVVASSESDDKNSLTESGGAPRPRTGAAEPVPEPINSTSTANLLMRDLVATMIQERSDPFISKREVCSRAHQMRHPLLPSSAAVLAALKGAIASGLLVESGSRTAKRLSLRGAAFAGGAAKRASGSSAPKQAQSRSAANPFAGAIVATIRAILREERLPPTVAVSKSRLYLRAAQDFPSAFATSTAVCHASEVAISSGLIDAVGHGNSFRLRTTPDEPRTVKSRAPATSLRGHASPAEGPPATTAAHDTSLDEHASAPSAVDIRSSSSDDDDDIRSAAGHPIRGDVPENRPTEPDALPEGDVTPRRGLASTEPDTLRTASSVESNAAASASTAATGSASAMEAPADPQRDGPGTTHECSDPTPSSVGSGEAVAKQQLPEAAATPPAAGAIVEALRAVLQEEGLPATAEVWKPVVYRRVVQDYSSVCPDAKSVREAFNVAVSTGLVVVVGSGDGRSLRLPLAPNERAQISNAVATRAIEQAVRTLTEETGDPEPEKSRVCDLCLRVHRHLFPTTEILRVSMNDAVAAGAVVPCGVVARARLRLPATDPKVELASVAPEPTAAGDLLRKSPLTALSSPPEHAGVATPQEANNTAAPREGPSPDPTTRSTTPPSSPITAHRATLTAETSVHASGQLDATADARGSDSEPTAGDSIGAAEPETQLAERDASTEDDVTTRRGLPTAEVDAPRAASSVESNAAASDLTTPPSIAGDAAGTDGTGTSLDGAATTSRVPTPPIQNTEEEPAPASAVPETRQAIVNVVRWILDTSGSSECVASFVGHRCRCERPDLFPNADAVRAAMMDALLAGAVVSTGASNTHLRLPADEAPASVEPEAESTTVASSASSDHGDVNEDVSDTIGFIRLTPAARRQVLLVLRAIRECEIFSSNGWPPTAFAAERYACVTFVSDFPTVHEWRSALRASEGFVSFAPVSPDTNDQYVYLRRSRVLRTALVPRLVAECAGVYHIVAPPTDLVRRYALAFWKSDFPDAAAWSGVVDDAVSANLIAMDDNACLWATPFAPVPSAVQPPPPPSPPPPVQLPQPPVAWSRSVPAVRVGTAATEHEPSDSGTTHAETSPPPATETLPAAAVAPESVNDQTVQAVVKSRSPGAHSSVASDANDDDGISVGERQRLAGTLLVYRAIRECEIASKGPVSSADAERYACATFPTAFPSAESWRGALDAMTQAEGDDGQVKIWKPLSPPASADDTVLVLTRPTLLRAALVPRVVAECASVYNMPTPPEDVVRRFALNFWKVDYPRPPLWNEGVDSALRAGLVTKDDDEEGRLRVVPLWLLQGASSSARPAGAVGPGSGGPARLQLLSQNGRSGGK